MNQTPANSDRTMSMLEPPDHEASLLAEARSLAYGLIAGVLRYPEEASWIAMTDSPAWGRLVQDAHLLGDEVGRQLTIVVRAIVAHRRPGGAVEAGFELGELQQTFNRLFGHAVRGECPLYESEYGRRDIVQQAPELADIAGFYAAAGLELVAGERADHASVECELLSALAAKEAYAFQIGDMEAVAVLRQMQRAFLADHLGRWLPALAGRIERNDPGVLYSAVARLARSLLSADCAKLYVTMGTPFLELAPADPESETEMTCGVEGTCPDADGDTFVQIGLTGNLA